MHFLKLNMLIFALHEFWDVDNTSFLNNCHFREQTQWCKGIIYSNKYYLEMCGILHLDFKKVNGKNMIVFLQIIWSQDF